MEPYAKDYLINKILSNNLVDASWYSICNTHYKGYLRFVYTLLRRDLTGLETLKFRLQIKLDENEVRESMYELAWSQI